MKASESCRKPSKTVEFEGLPFNFLFFLFFSKIFTFLLGFGWFSAPRPGFLGLRRRF